MKRELILLLEKAERSLKAAVLLHKKGDYDFSVSRAYYAMFYAAEAALLSKNQTYSKHAGVISGFYHHFVATGDFPKQLHQVFHNAFEDRNQGDYAFMDPFPKKESEEVLENARDFINKVDRYLKAGQPIIRH